MAPDLRKRVQHFVVKKDQIGNFVILSFHFLVDLQVFSNMIRYAMGSVRVHQQHILSFFFPR